MFRWVSGLDKSTEGLCEYFKENVQHNSIKWWKRLRGDRSVPFSEMPAAKTEGRITRRAANVSSGRHSQREISGCHAYWERLSLVMDREH